MHLCFSSFGFSLGSEPCLLCLLVCNDPQLFDLLGLGGGSPFLSESGLGSCMCLFPELLSLCEGNVIIHFLSILMILLRFDFCNCRDPPIQHCVITVLKKGPAPQLRDLIIKSESVRLKGRYHRRMYHYWTVDSCKEQPLIHHERTTRQYTDVHWEFTARCRNNELHI